MGHTNAWSNPSKVSAADAVQMAAFLEERSQAPDIREVNRKFCELVSAKPGERLLEVGSGSGLLCRMLSRQLKPQGSIVGLDISPEMTIEARKYALAEGIGPEVAFNTGAAEALPYPDASFDGVIAARLLLHAADPEMVIREAKRVVKPGGRVMVMDWDFDTVAVDHPNRELTRRLLHWRSDQHGGNNWSGRQLWRHMQHTGFQSLSVYPLVSVVHSEVEGLTQSLWRAAQVAYEAGAISASEREGWEAYLKSQIRTGSFFASIVYFVVKGIVTTA